MCPIKVNTCKISPLPICGDGVMYLEVVDQMLGVEYTNIFYPELIHDNSKNNWAPFVAPESWSRGNFIIPGFFQTDADNIIS